MESAVEEKLRTTNGQPQLAYAICTSPLAILYIRYHELYTMATGDQLSAGGRGDDCREEELRYSRRDASCIVNRTQSPLVSRRRQSLITSFGTRIQFEMKGRAQPPVMKASAPCSSIVVAGAQREVSNARPNPPNFRVHPILEIHSSTTELNNYLQPARRPRLARTLQYHQAPGVQLLERLHISGLQQPVRSLGVRELMCKERLDGFKRVWFPRSEEAFRLDIHSYEADRELALEEGVGREACSGARMEESRRRCWTPKIQRHP
jgi:hypothetical protein